MNMNKLSLFLKCRLLTNVGPKIVQYLSGHKNAEIIESSRLNMALTILSIQ